MITVCSLFAWVFIPFLYMFGKAPANDDVTKFLFNFSQDHNPIYVSVAAGLIIVAGSVLMGKKGIVQRFFKELKG